MFLFHLSSLAICIAWLFELAGGAIRDFDNTCLPSEQRDAAFTIAALHQWDLGTDDPRCIDSAETVSLSLMTCHAHATDFTIPVAARYDELSRNQRALPQRKSLLISDT